MLKNFARVKSIYRFWSPQQNQRLTGKPVQSAVKKSGENSYFVNKLHKHNRLHAVENHVGNGGVAPNPGVDIIHATVKVTFVDG